MKPDGSPSRGGPYVLGTAAAQSPVGTPAAQSPHGSSGGGWSFIKNVLFQCSIE